MSSQESLIKELRADLDLKHLTIEKFQETVDELKAEIDYEKEKNNELTKWLSMLSQLSTDYSGTLTRVHKNLEVIDKLREDKFKLQRELINEKKKSNDLKIAYENLKKQRQEEQREYQLNETGRLLIEKSQLQETVDNLAREVDQLSQKNDNYLKLFQQKDFFECYEQALTELNALRDMYADAVILNRDNINLNQKNDTSEHIFSCSKLMSKDKYETLVDQNQMYQQ